MRGEDLPHSRVAPAGTMRVTFAAESAYRPAPRSKLRCMYSASGWKRVGTGNREAFRPDGHGTHRRRGKQAWPGILDLYCG